MNNFLLLMFGNESPFNIQLSTEDLMVKGKLFTHFGKHTASPRCKPAKMGRRVKALFREEKIVRQVGFIALWLSKFLFGEFPGYGVKSAFFHLAIQIA